MSLGVGAGLLLTGSLLYLFDEPTVPRTVAEPEAAEVPAEGKKLDLEPSAILDPGQLRVGFTYRF